MNGSDAAAMAVSARSPRGGCQLRIRGAGGIEGTSGRGIARTCSKPTNLLHRMRVMEVVRVDRWHASNAGLG
jgi:hypothetical protein